MFCNQNQGDLAALCLADLTDFFGEGSWWGWDARGMVWNPTVGGGCYFCHSSRVLLVAYKRWVPTSAGRVCRWKCIDSPSFQSGVSTSAVGTPCCSEFFGESLLPQYNNLIEVVYTMQTGGFHDATYHIITQYRIVSYHVMRPYSYIYSTYTPSKAHLILIHSSFLTFEPPPITLLRWKTTGVKALPGWIWPQLSPLLVAVPGAFLQNWVKLCLLPQHRNDGWALLGHPYGGLTYLEA